MCQVLATLCASLLWLAQAAPATRPAAEQHLFSRPFSDTLRLTVTLSAKMPYPDIDLTDTRFQKPDALQVIRVYFDTPSGRLLVKSWFHPTYNDWPYPTVVVHDASVAAGRLVLLTTEFADFQMREIGCVGSNSVREVGIPGVEWCLAAAMRDLKAEDVAGKILSAAPDEVSFEIVDKRPPVPVRTVFRQVKDRWEFKVVP